MNHPPIPKCKAFQKSEPTGRIYWFFNRCHGCYIENADEYEKPVIAAVAEVEWRKRARRWEDVIDWLWARWRRNNGFDPDTCIPDPYHGPENALQLMRARDECYTIANQWREWGEG